MARKYKPVERQIAEGDPRKRGVNVLDAMQAAQPQATRGLPNCPMHLKSYARRAWRFWKEEIEAMDMDRRPDAMMLEGACVSYQTYVQMQLRINTDGELIVKKKLDAKGQAIPLSVVKHPAVSIRNQALMQMKSFCSEFGLSPASRMQLAIGKESSQGEDLGALLSRPREKKLQAPTLQ